MDKKMNKKMNKKMKIQNWNKTAKDINFSLEIEDKTFE
jgi:hypothetical protein